MSAAELIEEAKKLPVRERGRLIESLLALEESQADSAETSGKTPWPDTLERAKRIFGDKSLPNFVLEERELSPY
jgi:hypothetical protein